MIYIDVRTKEEYDNGHKPDAIHHDIMDMISGIYPQIDRESDVTLYCESGNRSMMAKTLMENAGFVKVIDGGGIENFTNK